MEQVAPIIQAIFIVITLSTVHQFYRASKHSSVFLAIIFIIAGLQMGLGLTNFYENETTIPPRFLLLIAPAIFIIVFLFSTKKGRTFLDSLDLKKLTLLHAVRVPVELVLYSLFLSKAIPEIMTFKGRNFDILAGISAPFVYYFGFIRNQISNKVLIIWNLISLGLLLNIVILAVLSAKTPFQQFAFDQPNLAVAYFPFNWLPSVVVPLVLLSHLASLKQLTTEK